MLSFSSFRYDTNKSYLTSQAQSGLELITFGSEHVNVFAAEVPYCEPHWHSAPELIFVLSGEFEFVLASKEGILKKGEFLFIKADETHALEAKYAESTLVTCQFSPDLFKQIALKALQSTTIKRDDPMNGLIQAALFKLLSELVNPTNPFVHLANVYHLLSLITTHPLIESDTEADVFNQKDESVIKSAIEYINLHFEKNISVSDLATQAGVSYHHFSRLFKKISGYGVVEFVTMCRVNKAKMLLKNTSIAITDVSLMAGFSEHKQMIAAFNRYCKMPPSEFRKRYLSDLQWRNYEEQMVTHCKQIPLKLVLSLFH